MPYIGRNHIAGDHTSNFKVLDDISSYTETFNGSLATIISTTDNTIRIPEHRFIQGQRVTYSNGGGGNIGGLTNGTAYFVTFDTANTFKLATSLANANNNTNINLSSVGSGSSHTLTAAFDGVNTTFKITHGGGSSADIVNSAQLQIAINNVIQKANLDSTYTEGFLVVDSRKIQFKTAPTADDIFWGNIIANTIETFDIADLKIDNFTGDGTTTQFTLSRPVPNNQSIMVTIDGVLQHPSDKDTTRAYRVLSESIIEFSSPPPNPCDIQVRHLGFAGAATGEVSGFYGRTGNVVLGASDHITTGDITSRNINASGIVTASSFVGNLTGNVSGNLTVGGVLTYEDVTNVDSIGIITARSDIHVGAGVSAVGVGTFGSLDIGGDIDVDGHTNLDNVSVAGVTTFASSIKLNNQQRINFGNSSSSYIYYDSGGTTHFQTKGGNLAIASNIGNTYKHMISALPNNKVSLYYSGDEKIQTTTKGIQVGTGVTIETNGQATFSGISTFSDDVNFISANGDNIFFDKSANTLKFGDANIASFGNSQDLNIYHSGGHSHVQDTGSGELKLAGDVVRITDAATNETLARFTQNGSAELYHNNTKRLETFDNNPFVGVSVTNDVVLNGAGDTAYRWAVGGNASSNFKWSMYYANADGALRLFDNVNSRTVSVWKNTGAIELNYQASKKFETTSSGVTVTGTVTATSFSGDGSNLTGITQTTINNNANNRLITGSGTANTLEGEQYLTWDGDLFKINAATNDNPLQVDTGSSNGAHMRFFRNGTQLHFFGCGAGISLGDSEDLSIRSYDNILLSTGNSSSEKVRITSGGKIGMGVNNTSPNGALDIRTTDDDDAIRLVNTSTGNNGIQWWNEYGGLTKRVSMDYGEGDANFDIKCFRGDAQTDRPYGNVRIFTGDYSNPNMNFRVTTLGSVHHPNQPGFHVYNVSGNQSQVLTFANTHHNIGNHMNISTGKFTAPISGRYLFTFAFLHNTSPTVYARVLFQLNGTRNTNFGDTLCDDTGLYLNTSMSMIFNLSANDTVELFNEGNNIYGSQYGAFSGILVA